MLKQRVITAIVLLVIFIPTLLIPQSEPFGLLTLVFIAIAGWEWARLNEVSGTAAYALGGVVTLVCALAWYFSAQYSMPLALWYVLTIFWVVIVPIVLIKGGLFWKRFPKALCCLIGVLALSIAWLSLWQAKLIGNNFLLSILVLVWAADSGAYFFGKAFGKHKLAPSISPGKSWEGAIGGLVTVMVIATAWVLFEGGHLSQQATSQPLSNSLFSMLYSRWSWLGGLAIICFLVMMSIVGDLFESLMKRSVGIKDSSNILPGHGGVLDRIDALLPVVPLALLLAQ